MNELLKNNYVPLTITKCICAIGIVIAASNSAIIAAYNEDINKSISTNLQALKSSKFDNIYSPSVLQLKEIPRYSFEVMYDISSNKFKVKTSSSAKDQEIKRLNAYLEKNAYTSINGMSASEYYQSLIKHNPELTTSGLALLELHRMKMMINEPIKHMSTIPVVAQQLNWFDKMYQSEKITDVRHIVILKSGKVIKSANIASDAENMQVLYRLEYTGL